MSKPIIEALFGRGAKAKAVQWLYLQNEGSEPIGARALARQADIAYGSINKTLQELVDSQLVVREQTSHGPQYRAPHEDPRLAGLFKLIRQDSELVGQLNRALRGYAKAITYAGVFGSFASGKTVKNSDVDVLILADTGVDRFSLLNEFSKVGERVGREVSVQFYSVAEFGEKLKNEDPVALSILANPRIDLKGTLPWQH
jgi:predicted nucleotidyltransferase